jgi:hypothetical protein
MVGSNEGYALIQDIGLPVGKLWPGYGAGPTQLLMGVQIITKSNTAQGYHHPDLFKGLEFVQQVGSAVEDLLTGRFVVGRGTVDDGCDVTVVEGEPVPAMCGSRLVGKSCLMQGPE